jgi:hypothetical protein
VEEAVALRRSSSTRGTTVSRCSKLQEEKRAQSLCLESRRWRLSRGVLRRAKVDKPPKCLAIQVMSV